MSDILPQNLRNRTIPESGGLSDHPSGGVGGGGGVPFPRPGVDRCEGPGRSGTRQRQLSTGGGGILSPPPPPAPPVGHLVLGGVGVWVGAGQALRLWGRERKRKPELAARGWSAALGLLWCGGLAERCPLPLGTPGRWAGAWPCRSLPSPFLLSQWPRTARAGPTLCSLPHRGTQ